MWSREWERLKKWARQLKKYVFVVYMATKDRRVPWNTKLLAMMVAAYAFSPIDLIPDFIPVLGYVDDLLIVPLGIWLVLRLLPESILQNLSSKAEERIKGGKPKNYYAAVIIVLIWLLVIFGILVAGLEKWKP